MGTDDGEEAAGLGATDLHRLRGDEGVEEDDAGAWHGQAWRLGRHHE